MRASDPSLQHVMDWSTHSLVRLSNCCQKTLATRLPMMRSAEVACCGSQLAALGLHGWMASWTVGTSPRARRVSVPTELQMPRPVPPLWKPLEHQGEPQIRCVDLMAATTLPPAQVALDGPSTMQSHPHYEVDTLGLMPLAGPHPLSPAEMSLVFLFLRFFAARRPRKRKRLAIQGQSTPLTLSATALETGDCKAADCCVNSELHGEASWLQLMSAPPLNSMRNCLRTLVR